MADTEVWWWKILARHDWRSELRPTKYSLYTYLRFWVTERQIDRWVGSRNVFFILSIGRSGTAFLADLLNRAEGALVVHEPVREDFRAHQEAFHSEARARHYVRRFRKKEIYLRVRHEPVETYGEVNSVLRRHCLALKEVFPKATFLHLVRDGRDVVRSMMSRATMTPADQNTKLIWPKTGDSARTHWAEMSRFEKLCWYWKVENEFLRSGIRAEPIQFEKLIGSYEDFIERICQPCGIEISRDVWKRAVGVPKNATKDYRFPHWSEWDPKTTKAFDEMCGQEMVLSGYSG